MTWVAWRQYRTELLIALGILAALMAYLIPTGLDRHALFQDLRLDSCLTLTRDCMDSRSQVGRSYDSVRNIINFFNFAPAIAAMILAAPIRAATSKEYAHDLGFLAPVPN